MRLVVAAGSINPGPAPAMPQNRLRTIADLTRFRYIEASIQGDSNHCSCLEGCPLVPPSREVGFLGCHSEEESLAMKEVGK